MYAPLAGNNQLTFSFSCKYVKLDLAPVIGLSQTNAFWPARPFSTCRSVFKNQNKYYINTSVIFLKIIEFMYLYAILPKAL